MKSGIWWYRIKKRINRNIEQDMISLFFNFCWLEIYWAHWLMRNSFMVILQKKAEIQTPIKNGLNLCKTAAPSIIWYVLKERCLRYSPSEPLINRINAEKKRHIKIFQSKADFWKWFLIRGERIKRAAISFVTEKILTKWSNIEFWLIYAVGSKLSAE